MTMGDIQLDEVRSVISEKIKSFQHVGEIEETGRFSLWVMA